MAYFARAFSAVAFLLCCPAGALLAQDASGSGGSGADELKLLRQTVEQQSRQIDVLAQEVARLNLLIEARLPPGAAGLTTSPAGLSSSPAEAPPSNDAAIPKAVSVQPAAATPAPAAPSGPVHIVTKGETLTAIARHYKVTVQDLLKVNKIADVRKLQIGQTLALPPDAKVPQSPTPAPQPQ